MESPKHINNVYPGAMVTSCVCKLCFKIFDDNAHIATVIPRCGHTFCEQCIDRLTDDNTQTIACPDCVQAHTYVDMQPVWKPPIDGHAVHTCDIHGDQFITEYCKTCREGICKTCADSLHSNGSHSVTNLIDFEEEKRSETILRLNRMQVEKERLINVQHTLSSSLETLMSATEADMRAIKDTFRDCRKWLKDYEDKLVAEVKSASALPLAELTHVQKELKLKIDTIECHEIEADEAFHSQTPLICATLCHYLSDSMSEIEQNSGEPLELPEATPYRQYIVRKNMMDSLQTVSMNSTVKFDTKTAPSRCTVRIGPAFVEEKCLISIQATDYMGRMNHIGGDVVRAILITPDQTSIEATVSDMDNGCYQVTFKPTCDGEYTLHLYVFEEELPDSPFTISTTKIDMVSRSQAWVGGRCKVNIKASSTGSNFLTLKDISAKILTPDGEYAELKVDGSKNSFNVTFYTKKQGRHRIILSVHGQKIEKPFDISIADHLQIGGEGSQLTRSSTFSDLMVTEAGELLVSDTEENKRLQRFSLHGKHLGDVEIPGIDSGPTRIAYDNFLKRIILLFYESGFLQILHMNGQLIKRFKVRRRGSSDPRGLATCSRGRIYVSDFLNHVVYTFKGSDDDCGTPYPGSDGLMSTIGGEGTLPGKFKHPSDVRIDIRNTLFVLDGGNCRIQHLDKAGRSLHIIMLDRLARWVSIIVPLDGTVMTRGYSRPTSGSVGQQIVRFSIDTKKEAIKQHVSAHLPLDSPLNFVSGIALTHEGCVYLLDHLSNCIRKYRYDWTSVFQK